MTSPADAPRCGRWRLKPFELERPVLLGANGPLPLRQFLAQPDPRVVERFRALDPAERQELVLARIRGAPPDRPIALFGQGGYTFGDAIREVEQGTSLGVRIIDAECKLVGMLLTEALSAPEGNAGEGPSADEELPEGL